MDSFNYPSLHSSIGSWEPGAYPSGHWVRGSVHLDRSLSYHRLTHTRTRHRHTNSYTPAINLKFPVLLTCMSLEERGNPRRHRMNMQTPHRKDLIGFEPRTFLL